MNSIHIITLQFLLVNSFCEFYSYIFLTFLFTK
nr:MAG TPA: hypothetical protein [Caudoviricetes sp.]